MLTNGEDGPNQILQLMPPSGYERYGVVRQNYTAGAKLRPNKSNTVRDNGKANHKYNSLNLTGTNMLNTRNEQLAPALLGRIEENKFVSANDLKVEQEREEAIKRRAMIDKLYMPLIESDM